MATFIASIITSSYTTSNKVTFFQDFPNNSKANDLELLEILKKCILVTTYIVMKH